MKKLLMSAALLTGLSPVMAGEVTIRVPDTFGLTMQNASVALERCMGAIVVHGDTSTCTAVQSILRELAALPAVPVNPPAPAAATPAPNPSPAPVAAAPSPSPTPEASASPAPTATPSPSPSAEKKS